MFLFYDIDSLNSFEVVEIYYNGHLPEETKYISLIKIIKLTENIRFNILSNLLKNINFVFLFEFLLIYTVYLFSDVYISILTLKVLFRQEANLRFRLLNSGIYGYYVG